MIVIDLERGELSVELSDSDLAARMRDWSPPPPRYKSGVLAKYAALVSPASEGAITSGAALRRALAARADDAAATAEPATAAR